MMASASEIERLQQERDAALEQVTAINETLEMVRKGWDAEIVESWKWRKRCDELEQQLHDAGDDDTWREAAKRMEAELVATTHRLRVRSWELDEARKQLAKARALLSTACDAWDEGQWNSLIDMQQLYLTRAWREEAERICGQS